MAQIVKAETDSVTVDGVEYFYGNSSRTEEEKDLFPITIENLIGYPVKVLRDIEGAVVILALNGQFVCNAYVKDYFKEYGI